MITNAIPTISATAATSASSNTELEIAFEPDTEDSVEPVLVVVSVDDVSLPPSVSSLNAFPPLALAATAMGAHMPAPTSAATAHRQQKRRV